MDEQTNASPRHTLDGAFEALRGLGVRRNTEDRWLAGVCSGIADRLGVDPLIIRGVLIVLLFLGGAGGLAYLLAWALLPDQNGRIVAEDGVHGDGWGIALLVVIGIFVVSNAFDRWWQWTVLLPVSLIGWWAIRAARMGKTPEQMSEEARRFASRVSSSVSSQQDASPAEASAPGGSSTAGYAGSSAPYAGAPASTQPWVDGPVPHGMGPGRTGTVTAPPRVVQRGRPRGGLLALLLTAGLAVAAYGLGTMLATDHGWSGTPALIGAGFALAGAGLALALVGLAGRRAGFTTLLVTVLAVGAVAGTSFPTLPRGGFGDRAWTASAQPADGFSLTAGNAKLSLAGATMGSTVRVSLGAGELTVVVPQGVVADVTSTVSVGELAVDRVGRPREKLDGGVDAARERTVTVGTGSIHVAVVVSVGAGQVTIVEES